VQQAERGQHEPNDQYIEKYTLQGQDDMWPEIGFGQALAEQIFEEFAQYIAENKQQHQQDELADRILGVTDPEKLKIPERRKIFHGPVSHKARSSRRPSRIQFPAVMR